MLKTEEKYEQFDTSFELVDIESNPHLDDIKLDLDFLYEKKDVDKDEILKFFEDRDMKAQIKSFDKNMKLLDEIYD